MIMILLVTHRSLNISYFRMIKKVSGKKNLFLNKKLVDLYGSTPEQIKLMLSSKNLKVTIRRKNQKNRRKRKRRKNKRNKMIRKREKRRNNQRKRNLKKRRRNHNHSHSPRTMNDKLYFII